MEQPYSFLYVEDDPLSSEVMRMMLEMGLGYTDVTIFRTSDDFMSRLTALPRVPAVILLDIHVQPIDGFAMYHMIRSDEAYRCTRVIALTASVMSEEIERLRQSGFDGVIAKPLSIQTFPELMIRVINGESVWSIA
ncbi:MAG: response regulator [Anaerolinea sp.]|nr:response regulator [Anaerolinea sp.]